MFYDPGAFEYLKSQQSDWCNRPLYVPIVVSSVRNDDHHNNNAFIDDIMKLQSNAHMLPDHMVLTRAHIQNILQHIDIRGFSKEQVFAVFRKNADMQCIGWKKEVNGHPKLRVHGKPQCIHKLLYLNFGFTGDRLPHKFTVRRKDTGCRRDCVCVSHQCLKVCEPQRVRKKRVYVRLNDHDVRFIRVLHHDIAHSYIAHLMGVSASQISRIRKNKRRVGVGVQGCAMHLYVRKWIFAFIRGLFGGKTKDVPTGVWNKCVDIVYFDPTGMGPADIKSNIRLLLSGKLQAFLLSFKNKI